MCAIVRHGAIGADATLASTGRARLISGSSFAARGPRHDECHAAGGTSMSARGTCACGVRWQGEHLQEKFHLPPLGLARE
jgi:hypothetical protein